MSMTKKFLCMLVAILMVPGLLPVLPAAAAEEAAVTPLRQPQDVSAVLNATMAQLAATVTEPNFGTNAGEWTVFALARGNHFGKDHAYFTDYYARIAEYVDTTATAVNKNGALDKNKSTDNSRLIMALSAIGRDATCVGGWDLVEAYSANGMNWIRRQGMNGTIWTLIALDSGNYETSDPTLRQQCVDSILSMQHNDGGWSLVTAKAQPSNVDITGMTLTALYPYRDQPAVAAACEQAFSWMSQVQLANGGFPYGMGETSESCVWAIVACTTWGIDPDTDARFIKNGCSPIDNLLTYYLPLESRFEHGRGAGANAMATDQCCYGLIAYDRLQKGKPALYDYSDVIPDTVPEAGEMTAALTLPENINGGDPFKGVISIDGWDNTAGYKLIDFVMNIPQGVAVTDVAAGSRLSGGTALWNVEAATGKLRVVYFDAGGYSDLTVSGTEFPAELFTVSLRAGNVAAGSRLNMGISGMSVKRASDPEDQGSMTVIHTEDTGAFVNVVTGISFSAKCLYTGDGVDRIPESKKSVAVAVTAITGGVKLTYNDGTHTVDFKYSPEITEKTGVSTYVALVDTSIPMENFVNGSYFTLPAGDAAQVIFGDANGDGVVNAQDALRVVDTWLRKGDQPSDDEILAMNVNGDSRINPYDALGIVEAFVRKTDYILITKAATITENS